MEVLILSETGIAVVAKDDGANWSATERGETPGSPFVVVPMKEADDALAVTPKMALSASTAKGTVRPVSVYPFAERDKEGEIVEPARLRWNRGLGWHIFATVPVVEEGC